MAEQGTGEALGALKRVFENVNPAPAQSQAGVWIYPQDFESIEFTTLPVVVLSEVVNNQNQWLYDAHDLSESVWAIEALVFLYPGPLTTEPAAHEAEKLHNPWPLALADILYNQQDLYRTVVRVGQGKKLFDWTVGQIDFWQKVFWGIRFVLPVSQSHSH